MDRLKFYETTSVNGITELDYLKSNLHKFQPKYPVVSYRIKETDLMRPDLISYQMYQTVEYWWLILMYNQVLDPFSELKVGDLLYIPNMLDIYEYYKEYRVRR